MQECGGAGNKGTGIQLPPLKPQEGESFQLCQLYIRLKRKHHLEDGEGRPLNIQYKVIRKDREGKKEV